MFELPGPSIGQANGRLAAFSFEPESAAAKQTILFTAVRTGFRNERRPEWPGHRPVVLLAADC
ncbi:hypothetical protein, partial [Bacillus sp. SIMBA_031]|uniref:hypothetical protein n=1 Tax=Bacillus sp. SIMBA_031 TaxID=3085774 RepID=UPI00397E3449